VAAADGETTTPAAGRLVLPGSFDPLHEGHRLMARIAEEIAERPLSWEISVTNVDKPLLDYLSIRDRTAQFAGQRLWLTRAARFTEKLSIFPEGTFVMGADTFVRLADPRYYGGSTAAAEEAVEAIAERARGLIVFGRTRNGVFEDASQIDAPQRLRDVSYFVSQREFRLDISSTELRRQENERRETACEA
jgi:nicotinic acid mononucleotide adenylyltransferase